MRSSWRAGVVGLVLERRADLAGDVRRAGEIRSPSNSSIELRRKSTEASGRCGRARERVQAGIWRRGLTISAGNAETWRRTARAPAIKSGSLGALWRGLFGGNDRGGRVLLIGTNVPRFEALKLWESNREGDSTVSCLCVNHVRGLKMTMTSA